MTWSLRRNSDLEKLPASHTIEITFKLPRYFSSGGVSKVTGIMMTQAEQDRGEPLGAVSVKVSDNFFLIGLAAAERDRNLRLLKERSRLNLVFVYDSGRSAVLSLVKDTPGERAFAEAFAAWERSQAVSPWQPVTVANSRPDIKTPIVQSRRVGRGLQMFLINTTDTRIRNSLIRCQYLFGSDAEFTKSATLFIPNTLSPGDEFQPDRSFFQTLECSTVSFEREIQPHAGAQ